MKEIMNFLMEITEGHPGAIAFATESLAEAQKEGDGEVRRWLVAFQRANEIGLKGPKLYLVWDNAKGRDNQATIDYLINESAASILALAGALGK